MYACVFVFVCSLSIYVHAYVHMRMHMPMHAYMRMDMYMQVSMYIQCRCISLKYAKKREMFSCICTTYDVHDGHFLYFKICRHISVYV